MSAHPLVPRSTLRLRAESQLATALDAPTHAPTVVTDEMRLTHELRVHQVELELQNDELLQAESALTASRDRYRALFDNAPVGYAALGANRRIVDVNRTLAALLGRSPAALAGRPLAAFMPEAHADALHLHLRAVQASAQRQACEVELLHADGSTCWVRLESVPDDDPLTNPGGVLVAVVDLSEQRRAQDEARHSEARLRDIANHIDDVLYVREPGGWLSYVSPAYERIWGQPTSQAAANARGWLDSIDPLDQEVVDQAHRRLQEGGSLDVEYRITRPDGTSRWIRDHASPVRGADDVILRYVGVARDITNERRLEDELRQASKMEAIDTLAAGIAHDFRNLLHGIAGSAAVAERDLARTGGRVGEYLRQIRDASRRGATLTDQLMAFSRRQDAERPRPLGIDALIEESAPLLMRLVGEQVSVELQLQAPAASVMADPVQLERILMNLASNASDAMPEGGALVIRTQAVTLDADDPQRAALGLAGPCVRLEVRDTGTGMDETTRQRIFEPFFTTKSVGKGTGLGLSAVFGITHKLGGRVAVESALGVGTTFTFWLPRCTSAGRREPTAPHVAAPLSGLALLVEDDPLVRASIRAELGHLGMRVAEADDPLRALEVVEALATPPSLLVTDVMMPHMTGPRLAERLRARLPELRVLLVSAHSAEDLIERGTLPPGSTVLRKPFDQAALAQRVGEVLAGQALAPAAPGAAEPTILLVDDDEDGLGMLATLLEHEGFHVLTAEDAEAALQLAAAYAGTIHVLVTDLSLPELSGKELARRLRAQRPALAVMFLSGSRPTAEVEREGYAMLKPVDFVELVSQLRQRLHHASEAPAAQ